MRSSDSEAAVPSADESSLFAIKMMSPKHHDASVADMRTTITLDPDVANRLEELRRERGWTFKEAVNATLRRGFSAAGNSTGQPYVMPVRDLGMRADIDVDRIRDELAADDDARLNG